MADVTGDEAKKRSKGAKKGKKAIEVKDRESEGGLSVEDILALGGEKEDLAFLADVDDGGDEADFGGDSSSKDDLKLDDIQSFVKKLGLPGFAAKTKAKEKGKTTTESKDPSSQQPKQSKSQLKDNEPRTKDAENLSTVDDDGSNREKKKKKKKKKNNNDEDKKVLDKTVGMSIEKTDGAVTSIIPESEPKESEPTKKKRKIIADSGDQTSPKSSSGKPQSSFPKPREERKSTSEESSKSQKPPRVNNSNKVAAVGVTSSEPPTTEVAVTKKKNEKKKKKESLVQFEEVSSSHPPEARSTPAVRPVFDASVVARWSSAHKVRRHAIVKPGGRWYDQTPADALVDDRSVSKECLVKLNEFALQLLKGDAACFQQSKTKFMKGDMAFIGNIINTGTLNDKTAAQTLLIQESPVHSLDNLDGLLNMAKKKGRREALMAMSTLKDLFIADLLPEDQKLITFERRPLAQLDEIVSGNIEAREKRLILWKFEDELKKRFLDFVKAVETLLSDSLIESRKQALSVNFDLLRSTPEREGILLEMLVNKLGDPNYKVAAKVVHLLDKLVQEHTDMDAVVVRNVEILLFRPNVKQKAQYYALCFLNNLILSRRKSALAESLLNIYFCCFNRYVKAGEVESKMLSALLLGVNRAFPFCSKNDGEGTKASFGTVDDQIEKHLQTIFRVVHTAHFNVSVQALMLLFQILGTREEIQDRFYRALYVKLLDPELERSSRQAMFLNLVYKAMMRDEAEKRVKAFVKRFLQISSQLSPPFICGVLVILSHVLRKHEGFFSFNKFMAGMSTLDKGAKGKGEQEEEVEKANSAVDSDDEEEHFKDVVEEGECASIEGTARVSSWVHRDNLAGGSRKRMADNTAGKYDPLSRNPLYCGADQAVVFELNALVNHFHPSVSLFARRLLQEEDVAYNGDPLVDFTLARFLERFVYKNPKKVLETLEKDHSAAIQSRKKRVKVEGVKRIAVNSKEFLDLEEEKIPVDEKFFRQFFAQKQKLQEAKKAEKKEELAEDVDDDEFDKFLQEHHEHVDEFEADFAAEATKAAAGADGKKKRKRQGDGSDDEDEEDEDDDDFGDVDEEDEEEDADEDMDDEGVEKDDELKLDEKAMKEMDDAVGSEIDEELEEILKGGDAEEDEVDWGEDEEEEEEEDEEDDDQKELDEENIAFSGSEDEFQDLEKPTEGKSKKELKRKTDVPFKSVGKVAKNMKRTNLDDYEDDGGDMDEFDFIEKASAKAQKGGAKKATKGGNKLSDLFADAEEFSHLLEDNVNAGKGGKGGRSFDMLGLGALSNKDKASVKQLEWESSRDKWVRGEDWRKKGKPNDKHVGNRKIPKKNKPKK